MDTLSQKYQLAFLLKTAVRKDMIFIRLSPAMKQLLEKVNLNSHTSSIFPALDIKTLAIVTFRHNFGYMVNSFVVSLDITVMVNILQ